MEPIELSHTIVSYIEPVVYLKFKEGAELDVKEIRELTAAARSFTNGKPYLLLSDARVNVTISPEARELSARKEESPFLIANAALIDNLPLKLVANFFSKINKPHFHFRTFTDEKKAMEWMMQFDPRRQSLK